jgi:glucose-1-phosphate cytidylyltransferase
VSSTTGQLGGMQAIILCGGLGMRLREETEFRPKPMIPIGGRPILWHIMNYYHAHGVQDFILCLGYKGDVIRDYFLNYRNHNTDIEVDLSDGTASVLSNHVVNWRVILAETGEQVMTGARIRKVIKYVKGERFFATYGDGVSNVDLGALLAFHLAEGRESTVTAVRPPARFGELLVEENLARSFAEKPQTETGWINGGFFVFETKAFDSFSTDEGLVLESEIVKGLAARGQLSVYRHPGFWQCMDTYREMQLLNQMWTSDAAPWKAW